MSGTIYELIDPRNNKCRYVGQTFDVQKRKAQHEIQNAYQGNQRLYEWKRSLWKDGQQTPKLLIIESEVSLLEINEREKFWVATRANEGCDLLNCAVGCISNLDLMGEPGRLEAAASLREVREMLIAIRERFGFSKSHAMSKQLFACEKKLIDLACSLTDY